MANVSSSNGLEKYPKLRFPGFTGPYTQCRIGDIYAERSQRGASDMELLSVTMNDGVVPRSDIEGKDNSSEDKSNYKVVHIGDMVYNSMRMWQGANGLSAYDGIVSPAYTVLMPKKAIIDGYFAALFKSSNLINEFRKNSQGMTSDTWNLKYPQIETIKVFIPCLLEQKKVSDLLGILEERIVKQAQLVELLKKYKRGLSNFIFDEIHCNKNNTAYVFDELFSILQNNTFSRDMMTNENAGVQNIHYGDVLIKFGSSASSECGFMPFIKEYIDLSKFSEESYLLSGDVVFADTAEDYTVGKATEIINPSGRRILSGLHTIPCRSNKPFASGYLGHYFNSKSFRKQILPLIQGTKVSSISKSELLKTTLVVPPIERQEECSRLLSTYDTKIGLLEQELNQMKQLKGGLLQQLFI